MSGVLLSVIIYDIPDDRRRRRIHSLLRQYGIAVQESAFEARLSGRERQQLVREAGKLLVSGEDSFVLYPIAREQERGIGCPGRPRPKVQTPAYFLL